MGMNQQFGFAVLAFVKLIESNLERLNHFKCWMAVSGSNQTDASMSLWDCSPSMRNLGAFLAGKNQHEAILKNHRETFLCFINSESTTNYTQVGAWQKETCKNASTRRPVWLFFCFRLSNVLIVSHLKSRSLNSVSDANLLTYKRRAHSTGVQAELFYSLNLLISSHTFNQNEL